MDDKTKILEIVKSIAQKLEVISYVLIGSVNLYLQGIKVNVRDVDILTTPEGIRKIDTILAEYRTKEIYFDETEGRNSWRSFYEIEGIEIEVLGNVTNAYRNPESVHRKVLVEIDGVELPCLVLAEEIEAYKLMGRPEKAKMIDEVLHGK